MPVFTYSARDRAGAPSGGSLDAPGRREALRTLSARGLSVSSLVEQTPAGQASKGGKPARKNSRPAPSSRTQEAAHKANSQSSPFAFLTAPRSRPLSTAQRLPFLQSLHDLTASGLSAGEAIRLLSVRLKEPALRRLCQGLWERISEGAPLSRAMSAFPEVFDNETVNLIAAGETTGSLNDTLGRVIQRLTEQAELRSQLLTALAYPAFLFMVASGLVMFFLFYLLPRVQGLLNSLGGNLPSSTKLLIALANFALHYGIFVIAAAIFVAITFWRWRSTRVGRHQSDLWMLRIPMLGTLLTSQTILAISQTLASLLENGITTAEALRMTERQISNSFHREAFASASARVLEGESLSLALGRTGCFPDLVLDRLAVGENTGNIVPSLRDIGRTYQKRITSQLQTTIRVLVSAFMISVFVFVGFIAFAIVSAVFSMSASLRM